MSPDLKDTPLLEGNYQLLEELGRGGMGTVYRARDESLGRMVAVKFLLPELQEGADQAMLFQREAKAMASVRHENVVQIYSFGKQEDTNFFVMEFINGKTGEQLLSEAIGRESFLPIADVMHILVQAADGLAAVHGADVVHRDIKPANIMVEEDTRRVVIMDFGIGKRQPEGGGELSQFFSASPAYISPEMVSGQAKEQHLFDIYAMGVTAFELVTGRLPFEAENWVDICAMHVTDTAPVPSTLRSDVPAELDEVILRCMAKEPADRFQSAHEVSAALRSIVDPQVPARDRPSMSATKARNNQLVTVLIADPDRARRNRLVEATQDAIPGCRLRETRTNSKAAQLVMASPPSLLIARLDDPRLNGLELAGQLHEQIARANTRIVLTAKEIAVYEREMLKRLGVHGIILDALTSANVRTVLAEEAADISRAAESRH